MNFVILKFHKNLSSGSPVIPCGQAERYDWS